MKEIEHRQNTSKNQRQTTTAFTVSLLLPVLMLFLLSSSIVLAAGGSAAPQSKTENDEENWEVPVHLVSMITQDDHGKPLNYPSTVFSDRVMNETYVVTGGGGRINIYADNFFPLVSLGKGRGVDSPRGVLVDRDGRLFICQGDNQKSPTRITILNGALFTQQEIFMSDIPGTENFLPHRIAMGLKGELYLAGLNHRGVLILDKNGKFLRWLKPEDQIRTAATGEETELTLESLEEQTADLPAELTPEIGRLIADDEDERNVGPVQITDLTTDNDGHLYLLSEETGKIYVYRADDELLFTFGKKGGSSGKLSRPRGVALDTKRRCVYVVDYMRHTILVYDLSGRFLFEFGGLGLRAGWFNFPTDVAVDSQGRVIVADLFNQRVQVLELEFPASYPLFPVLPKGSQGKSVN